MDKKYSKDCQLQVVILDHYFPSLRLNFVLCKVGGDGVETKDPSVASPHLNSLWFYFNFISVIGFYVDHKLIKTFIRILSPCTTGNILNSWYFRP